MGFIGTWMTWIENFSYEKIYVILFCILVFEDIISWKIIKFYRFHINQKYNYCSTWLSNLFFWVIYIESLLDWLSSMYAHPYISIIACTHFWTVPCLNTIYHYRCFVTSSKCSHMFTDESNLILKKKRMEKKNTYFKPKTPIFQNFIYWSVPPVGVNCFIRYPFISTTLLVASSLQIFSVKCASFRHTLE